MTHAHDTHLLLNAEEPTATLCGELVDDVTDVAAYFTSDVDCEACLLEVRCIGCGNRWSPEVMAHHQRCWMIAYEGEGA